MPVVAEPSAIEEQVKWRRPRNQLSLPILETDPNPQIPSIIQSTRCKSTISSLLLSTFSNTTNNETKNTNVNSAINNKKKNNFTAATFRGLGCTAGASQQVSVPAVIRTSADWQGKKAEKKKHKRNSTKSNSNNTCQGVVDGANANSANCVDFQDVWCGPGIGFSTDAAASVDCVVARRNVTARGKIDSEKMSHRERPLCLERRTVKPETVSFLDSEPEYLITRVGSEVYGTSRYYRHVRNPYSEGLAEIMMLQGSLLMGGRLDSCDQFRDWRLDVDNMSYEELLELGERIGYVNTGLKEDEIGCHIRKFKLHMLIDRSVHQDDRKCSICQEEYEDDDELGRLNCGHSYHIQCIRQWVAQKNFCPVCKTDVMIRCRVAKS
ncbi:RING/U-box superfamily protein [Quillaja saponaria]|uniref:RING-type E3 ubiquitin transferase n=1 Tax=Quillaja saponaria TaxID=32244 RepID=A0AAD7M5W5_QUISA|nr:RING/U-box superfamily protein [Quillaja saponaria]